MEYLLVTLGVLIVAMLTASALKYRHETLAAAIYVAMFFYAATMGALFIASVT